MQSNDGMHGRLTVDAEPYGGPVFLRDESGHAVARIARAHPTVEDRAGARRLAAAWNATRGLPVEALEADAIQRAVRLLAAFAREGGDASPEYGDWGGDTERAEQWGLATAEYWVAARARYVLSILGVDPDIATAPEREEE